MPEETRDWVYFYPRGLLDEAADQVCQPIGEYGIPWMHEYGSLSGIKALDGNTRYRTSLSTWRRAVIAYLLGHAEQARQLLNDAIAKLEREGRPPASIDVNRQFAHALEEQIMRGQWHQ
jgi:predicted LPLAT superfamily acyltransferase